MSRPKIVDLKKHTLNLREGDFDKMAELFPRLGASVAVRQLISKFIDKHHRLALVGDLPDLSLPEPSSEPSTDE